MSLACRFRRLAENIIARRKISRLAKASGVASTRGACAPQKDAPAKSAPPDALGHGEAYGSASTPPTEGKNTLRVLEYGSLLEIWKCMLVPECSSLLLLQLCSTR